MKYIRLLRLEDHYVMMGIIICAGIYFNVRNWWILLWAGAVLTIAFSALILNELVDREDVDRHSWNPIHVKSRERYDHRIVAAMLIVFGSISLILSYAAGLFWWGISMYSLGMLYSLKPFRLKAYFGLDIITQLLAAIIIPFTAVGWKYSHIEDFWLLVVTVSFICWGEFFPYQLADYLADKKAGLRGTHIVLGMNNSLVAGLLTTIIGVILFLGLGYHLIIPWADILLVIAAFVFIRYLRWLKMLTIAEQTASMQDYVRFVKPLTFFIIPYFLLIWWLA